MPSRTRSPSYPVIDLKAALEKAGQLYPHGKHPLDLDTIAEQWDYKPGASTVNRVVAALKKYDLIEEVEDDGDDRLLKLTGLAEDILIDPDLETKEAQDAIREAAIAPLLHAVLWDRWGKNVPAEAEIRRHLIKDRKFNDRYVDRAIQVYLDSIAFAGLKKDDKMEGGIEGNDEDQEMPDAALQASQGPKKQPAYTDQPDQTAGKWNGPVISFDLPRGNRVEIRLRSKLTPQEFEKLKKIFELSELAFVEDDPSDPEATGE